MIGDERILSYISSLEQDLPLYMWEIEQEALATHVPIIKKPTQSLLRFLMRNNKPKRVLEVGTAVGFSALLMREHLKEDARITTIERNQGRIDRALENFAREDKDGRITLIEGDASDILKQLVKEKKTFDFIFMDAAKGQYINFLEDIDMLLESGGLLVSDNVLQDGDVVESRFGVTRRNRTIHNRMREYLFTLTHHETYDTIVLPIGDGVTLSTKVK